MHFLAASMLPSVILAALNITSTSAGLNPFYLKVSSASNATLNSKSLLACHVGAALEKLCIDTLSRRPSFALNETYYAARGLKAGDLVYNMVLNGSQHRWTASYLDINYDSNVAVVGFGPSRAREGEHYPLSFDEEGMMSIYGSSRWHVCRSSTNGRYRYEVLAWVFGAGPASNDGEDCHPVNVTRVFPAS
jgi:hypothetical protein